jgi:hypothetical protein
MTQHTVSHAETPPETLLLEEALQLAHQLEATAATTRELARQAVQATLQAQAAARVDEGGRCC